ncbi:MAG: hypothetical protein ACREDV_13190 [Methylocella sp.]
MLLIVLAIPAEADEFNCRSSVLRINALKAQIYEPVVANPPDTPCVTVSNTLASIVAPLPILGVIAANVVRANTSTSPPFATIVAASRLEGLNILDTVTTGALRSHARVASVEGKCVLSSISSLDKVAILGAPVLLTNNYLKVTIPLVGDVQFNATLGGPTPTNGAPNLNIVTQRALWLQITNPLLQQTTGVKEVIVGEATVKVVGNPCKTGP